MLLNTIIAGLVSSITFSDSTAVGQIMISRPIVAAPIMGLIFGDVQTGILVGILFELLWVGTLPVGAVVPPESTFAAVNTVAIAVLSQNTEKGNLILIFFFLSPFIFLAGYLEDKIRARNNGLSKLADQLVLDNKHSTIPYIHLWGLSLFLVKTFLISVIAVALGVVLIPMIVENLPKSMTEVLNIGGDILPILGIAVVIDLLVNKNNWLYLIFGILLTFFVNIWVITGATIGVVIYITLTGRSISHEK